MIRLIQLTLLLTLLLACGRGKNQAVTITPHTSSPGVDGVPADPFGSASGAYERLREVADAAVATPWDGTLEAFAPWLEEQTVAVERCLNLLKALRVGPKDVYAVANGRIAMLYEHIAVALTEASSVAAAGGHDADWTGQQDRIWDQAQAFWGRCVRGCSMGGTHLDAWDLRCRAGLANSQAQLDLSPQSQSPRQPK